MTFRAVNFLAIPALALGVALALAPPGAPFAQAEQSCHITGQLMTPTAIKAMLVAKGYTTIHGLTQHNGCYEAKGIDAHGKRFQLELNGATGVVQNGH